MDIEIIQKYIAGDASPKEKEEVTLWIEASEENRNEFLALRKLYTITIWQPEKQQIHSEQISHHKLSTRRIGLELLKIAAIFIIAFSVVYIYISSPKSAGPESVMQTVYVPAGQRAQLTLADGTKVWLNAKTTFTFPNNFTNNSRNVTLDGEGYFNVTHDEKKPFIVGTEQFNIKVLGTEFNVYAYKGHKTFETALLKGSVQIESANQKEKLLLKPDQKAYTVNGHLITTPIKQYNYFLWKDGQICFDDNTISDLFKKLELYFDVKIIIENPQILNQRYSGKFRTSDGVEHVLKTLQLRTKFKYEKKEEKDNIIIIK